MKNSITYKDLTRKQKVEHIWEYYKWHIIGGIAIVFIIGSLVSTMLRPRPPVHAADLIITGKMSYDEAKLVEDQAHFEEVLNGGIEVMPNDWEATDMISVTNEQALSLKFQVKECDVLAIAPVRHEGFLAIEDFDAFYPLDTIQELEGLLSQYKDHLITGISREDGKEHVYGIRVSAFNHLDSIVLGEDYNVSILSGQKDLQAAVALVKYILE